MKRRDLERHLKHHGCVLDRHDGRHDVWVNLGNARDAAVPRHNEIKPGTARVICKQLGVPNPPKK